MTRFSLRDVFWLTLVVAVGVGWLIDGARISTLNRRLAEANECQGKLEALTRLLERKGIKWGWDDLSGVWIESKTKRTSIRDADRHPLDEVPSPANASWPNGPPVLPAVEPVGQP